MHAGRGQLQHPVDICWRDEMPGRAHHVRPEDSPFVHCALNLGVGRTRWHAQGQSPSCGRILLRLHGTEPGDDIGRLTVNCPRDALVVESLFGDCDVHRAGGEECVARRITFQI